ncbi:MAG: hypothetical protein J6T10_01565 [Methanobrevibacter sp.]|nr:hypothetical protein [Methanobrevibacter sp.]
MQIEEAKKYLTDNGFGLIKEKSKFDGAKIVKYDEMKQALLNMKENVEGDAEKTEQAEKMLKRLRRYTSSRFQKYYKIDRRINKLKSSPAYKGACDEMRYFARDYADLMDINENVFLSYKQSTDKLLGTLVEVRRTVLGNSEAKDKAKDALKLLTDEDFLNKHEQLKELASKINNLFTQWKAAINLCEDVVDASEEKTTRYGNAGYVADEEDSSFSTYKESYEMNEGILDFLKELANKFISAIKKIVGLGDDTIDVVEDFNSMLEKVTELNEELSASLASI